MSTHPKNDPTQVPDQGLQNENEKKKSAGSWIVELIVVIALALLFRQFIATPTLVFGNSMVPTLNHGNFLIESRISLQTDTIERGDIVILDPADGTEREFIKRVIGLGGDTVVIENGVVSINGTALDEPYTSGPTYTADRRYEIEVPEGYYYVLGDNRVQGGSNDSRNFGAIPEKSIKGIVVFRYFPFGEAFGPIRGWDYEKH